MRTIKRCNAMNQDGQQCQKTSAITHNYHGDGELYHYAPSQGKGVTWVKVNLCVDHFIGAGGSFIKTKLGKE